MGMVIKGLWTKTERLTERGNYLRQDSVFAEPIGGETFECLGKAAGRFHLIASASCQWSHRALIVLALKGVSDAIPVHLAHGPRVEGYAMDGGGPWPVPGAGREIVHLHQLYALGDANYTGRATVPVLWDSVERRIVSNESSRLFEAFDRVAPPAGAIDFTLLPPARSMADLGAVNSRIYAGLANGVYRAGFAETQSAYDEAVGGVFATLDWLEDLLSRNRYVLGQTLSAADWLLFPTLVRFDAVYHVLHRCCLRRLVDYPHLWAYARDLYSWRGIERTVDFDTIRTASYQNDTAFNPHRIVAVAPDADWRARHGRDRLGPARVFLRKGGTVRVDPASLSPESGE